MNLFYNVSKQTELWAPSYHVDINNYGYWKQIYFSRLCCELARYILSLCINARQLNSILQNIITVSDT